MTAVQGASELLERQDFPAHALRTIPHCPACNRDSSDAELVAEDFIEIFGDPHFFSVDLCPGCGLIYSRTRSINEDLYSPKLDLEKEHGHQRPPLAPLTEDAWNYRTKSRQVTELLGLAGGRNQIAYMEIGASDGTLYRMYRERAQLVGCDIEAVLVESSGAALPCEAISGCRILTSSAHDDLEVANGSRDLIVMSHCLEHFEDPGVLLTHMHQYLKPDGLIYIEVPDGLRFDRSVATPLGYFHITNFNVINLSAMVEAAGYELVDVVARDHYPGLRIVAQRAEARRWSDAILAPNPLSLNLSRSSLQRWRRKTTDTFQKFEAGNNAKRRLIYGAGTHAVALLRRYPEWISDGSTAFADSNVRLKQFLGQPVMSPADIDFNAFDQILVSTYAYQEEVGKALAEAGCPESKIYKFYDEVFAYVG